MMDEKKNSEFDGLTDFSDFDNIIASVAEEALSADPDTPPRGEEEFDPRFRVDRRKDGKKRAEYSYNGRRVSAMPEEHYRAPNAPDYEELRSSYTAQDDTDALFRDPEAEQAPPKGLKKLLHRRADRANGRPDQASAEAEAAVPPDPADEKPTEKDTAKKRKGIFRRLHSAEDLEDDTKIDFERDYEETSPSFSAFVSSRLAGILLKLRGNAPADSTSRTMEDVEEDLGPELAPMPASKYYGAQIYSLRIRTRLAFLMLVLLTYLSVGLPIPGMLQYIKVTAAACMALQLTIMLLSLDVVTNAVTNAVQSRFGADSLAVLSCLITTLDALAVINAENVYRHVPFCAVSSFSLFGVLLSSLLSARGIRKSLRVPAIGKKVYAVTSETNITDRDVTLLKSARPVTGFVRRMEEAPIDESVFRRLSPFIILVSLVLSILTAIVKRSPSNILYILSVILTPAVPFTALLAFALPFFVGSHRIFSSGAALAGWSGISDIGYSKNLIVTDRDLFPEENIEIENVRIFADYDAEKVITYAGSMILNSKSGLAPSFARLMEENSCSPVRIDNMQVLAGGGFKGMAEGRRVLCGCSDLMRLMNVRIPYRLISETSVLLAIDGVLYGIFNIKYTPDPKVRKALVSLMRSNRHPIFAIRDFNITPEFIHECFDVATDGYDFPPYMERFPISEAKPSADSQIAGVVCREGLGPLTDLADTGRSIFVISRINTILTVIASALALLISFIRILANGSVGAGSALLTLLLLALPVLALGVFANTVD